MLGIDDIAKDLNVSVSLVSKVLNGRLGTTRVSAKTVSAIRHRADTFGYRKNQSAAALATGRQNVIGVFIHRFGVSGSGLVERMLEGIGDEATRRGQRLQISFFSTDEEFERLAATMHPSMVDGAIMAGFAHASLSNRLRNAEEAGVPVVTLHERELAPGIVNVGAPQERIGAMATAHLIERGCHRIAHIQVQDDRTKGYLSALQNAGLPSPRELIYNATSFEFPAGEAAVRHFARQGIEYDGLVAQSDQQAVGALNMLTRLGRRVPEDVLLIGVDDSPFCRFSLVPISSVSQQEYQRGQVAVARLMDAIAHRSISSCIIEPTLHVRRSSTPGGFDAT